MEYFKKFLNFLFYFGTLSLFVLGMYFLSRVLTVSDVTTAPIQESWRNTFYGGNVIVFAVLLLMAHYEGRKKHAGKSV